jgi:chemotaxis response regulator CheB
MVKVLVADDSAVMRKAVKWFLEQAPEILLVGDADSFDDTIRKAEQLHPDVIVLDLHLVEKSDPTPLKSFLDGSKPLAITFGADDESRALAERLGIDILLDKINLTDELIPSILALHRRSALKEKNHCG